MIARVINQLRDELPFTGLFMWFQLFIAGNRDVTINLLSVGVSELNVDGKTRFWR